MAVDPELGLDAEGDEALIELLLDRLFPAGAKVASPELRHLHRVQVVIGDDREQLVGISDITAQSLFDDFARNALHGLYLRGCGQNGAGLKELVLTRHSEGI